MFKLNFNRQTILIGVAILGIIITGVLILADSSSSNILSSLKSNFLNSPKTTAENAVAYLNSNILKEGQKASMNSFSVESGVIKVNIKITRRLIQQQRLRLPWQKWINPYLKLSWLAPVLLVYKCKEP